METLFYSLGGMREIGKNLYCIEQNEEVIIIDAGIKFPSWDTSEWIEKIFPNLSYLKKKRILGIIITHGHEDHIGAITYLLEHFGKKNIYTSKFTSALLLARIEETFKKDKKKWKKIVKIVDEFSEINIPPFKISFFQVNHSIPGALGVIIHTNQGIIVATGDYKISSIGTIAKQTDLKKLSKLAKEQGIDLLLADSTNSEIEGRTPGEEEVIRTAEQAIKKTRGKVFFTSFATNFLRIKEIISVAHSLNRQVKLVGKSLERMLKISKDNELLGWTEEAAQTINLTNKLFKKEENNKQLLICTGSQGEQGSVLERIVHAHRHFITSSDSVILSSSAIPGNFLRVRWLEELLKKLTHNVLTNSDKKDKKQIVHVSGHAAKEEQKLLLLTTKPKYFIPIHGDLRMMIKQKETAESTGIKGENIFLPRNGTIISMKNGKCRIVEELDKKFTDPLFLLKQRNRKKSKKLIDQTQLDKQLRIQLNGILIIQWIKDLKNANLQLLTKGTCPNCFKKEKIKKMEKSLWDIIKIKLKDPETKEDIGNIDKQLKGAIRTQINNKKCLPEMIFVSSS